MLGTNDKHAIVREMTLLEVGLHEAAKTLSPGENTRLLRWLRRLVGLYLYMARARRAVMRKLAGRAHHRTSGEGQAAE